MKNLSIFCLPFFIILLISGCTSDHEAYQAELASINQQIKIDFEKRGIDPSEVVINNVDNAIHYGHACFNRKEYIEFMNLPETDDLKLDLTSSTLDNRVKGFGYNQRYRLVSHERVNDIKVFLGQHLRDNDEWYNATIQAVNRWNNIPNCQVRFKITTDVSQADINISMDTDYPTIPWRHFNLDTKCVRLNGELICKPIALGDWPLNNKPGRHIAYNASYGSEYKNKLRTAMHELGHAIGFHHHNSAEEDIPYTTTNLKKSYMYVGTDRDVLTDLSAEDKIAARYFYPIYIRTPSIYQVQRNQNNTLDLVLEYFQEKSVPFAHIEVEIYHKGNKLYNKHVKPYNRNGYRTKYTLGIDLQAHQVDIRIRVLNFKGDYKSDWSPMKKVNI